MTKDDPESETICSQNHRHRAVNASTGVETGSIPAVGHINITPDSAPAVLIDTLTHPACAVRLIHIWCCVSAAPRPSS